jgi:hypothetical protein
MNLKSFGHYSIVIWAHRIQVGMWALELGIGIPFSVGGMFTTTLQKSQNQPEACVSLRSRTFQKTFLKEHYFLSQTQQ